MKLVLTTGFLSIAPVISKVVPSVLASSGCWSLQCLIFTLTEGDGGGHFFRLTCSVALCGGRDAANNTGMCSQCLSHIGPAPAHSTCALPGPTAKALIIH